VDLTLFVKWKFGVLLVCLPWFPGSGWMVGEIYQMSGSGEGHIFGDLRGILILGQGPHPDQFPLDTVLACPIFLLKSTIFG